jgi:hypothetical protein
MKEIGERKNTEALYEGDEAGGIQELEEGKNAVRYKMEKIQQCICLQ